MHRSVKPIITSKYLKLSNPVTTNSLKRPFDPLQITAAYASCISLHRALPIVFTESRRQKRQALESAEAFTILSMAMEQSCILMEMEQVHGVILGKTTFYNFDSLLFALAGYETSTCSHHGYASGASFGKFPREVGWPLLKKALHALIVVLASE